jgi:putative tryptophan/tyrosine transport system substrate-binding protein
MDRTAAPSIDDGTARAGGQASRRQFMQGLGVLGLGLVAGCGSLAARAQPTGRIPRVGFLQLHSPTAAEPEPLLEAFQQGLRELGYVDGQNVVLEIRAAEHRPERYPALVDELLRLPVDVLVLGDSQAIPIAKQATSTVPIVMTISGDVVGQGLVDSLARPGGNLTGLTNLSAKLSGKRLELLVETLPGISRIGVLWNATSRSAKLQWDEAETASRQLGVQLQSLEVRGREDLPSAFEAALKESAEAILVVQDPLTISNRSQIATLAAESRLPAMYATSEFVESGGLMSYGPDRAAQSRRAATYVHKILQGTAPGELPVEQPRQFDFLLNTRTAGQLELTIPTSTLSQVTKVIK